ncbi:mechanosensitive ion channel family protein [Chitinophaga sp. sic0106]|uniref:mechanosensitive ion channel family protein n=1 Tax=Chitinophaga sp. sic0106 TaxID=2854785 RepID=UPI001C4466CF|nr:mechanosensitive ion channel domain-containing protein [Chitinophaga sp. sic0106]MBV7529908.1 mechanosensitive ion channel family protein [Chitinophaga sp. sic0106]
MMVTDEVYKRKNRKERILFLVKLLVYLAVVYFNLEHAAVYDKFAWLFRITNALTFFLGANLVISLAWLVIISWYTRRRLNKPVEKDNFMLGLNRISSVLNTIFVLLSIMILFGIDLLKFVTSITIVAAAIALLSKDYITNIINGLIIMFSDQLSLGDHVRIGEFKGKILDITLINLVLQSDDDEQLIVPNSLVFTSIVVNQSKQNVKKITIEFELDRKLPYTPDQLENRLKEAIKGFSDHYVKNSFLLRTLDIRKDHVVFKVQVIIPFADKTVEQSIRRTLNTEIISIAEKGV